MKIYSSSYISILIGFLVVSHSNGLYTKIQYKDCGSSDVIIHSISVEPMPIKYPGPMNMTVASSLKRPIDSSRISVNIMRTVSGIRMPVRCYRYDNLYIGSCNYTSEQLCSLISSWWPKSFGLYLTSLVSKILGNTCKNQLEPIAIQKVNTYQEYLQMPDLSSTILQFFMTGDFTTTVKAVDQMGQIFCGIFEYTALKG